MSEDDDIPPFSEVELASKLFRARAALSRADKIGGVIMGIVELVKFGVQTFRDRKKPPRVDATFRDRTLGSEVIYEAGRSMVGTPERTDLP
jgi:hypothetical protein